MQTEGPDGRVTDTETVSRRDFLGGAGAVAGGLMTLGAAAGLVAVPGVAHAALARTYAGNRLVLEMDGSPAGTLAAVQGGGPLFELLPDGKAVGATGLAVSYQPLDIVCNSAMSRPFYDWLTKAVATPTTVRAKTMSIVAYDGSMLELYRLALTGVRVTDFEVPVVDAASRESLKFHATLVADSATSQLPKGAIQGKALSVAQAKLAMACNFNFAIAGLESATRLVAAVGGIKLRLAEQAVDPRLRGPWTIGPLELEVAFSAAAPFYQWLDATLAGKDGERPGVLQLLTADLQNVMASIDMPRLGIAGVSAPSIDAASGTVRTTVQLYCRDVKLNLAGLAV